MSRRSDDAIARDLGHAATALQALAYGGRGTLGVAMSDAGEREIMQRMARSMAANLLPRFDDSGTLAAQTDMSAQAVTRYRTMIEVWKKPLVVIAQHSGTKVLKHSMRGRTWRYTGVVYYCNHGACPEESGSRMTHKCTSYGPVLDHYRLPVRSAAFGGHTCSTSYWATARKGHHNCHDDSSVQIRAILGQPYRVNTGRCNDSTAWVHAPECGAQ